MGVMSHGEGSEEVRPTGLLGPGAVDTTIRQAIMQCWMMLPNDKKSVERVEAEIRRIVDRALKDFQEDSDVFRT